MSPAAIESSERVGVRQGLVSIVAILLLCGSIAAGIVGAVLSPPGPVAGIGAVGPGRRRPVVYYRGALVPMVSVAMSAQRREVTCDGCPPAEGGKALVRDLATAGEVNLQLDELSAGWQRIAPAQPAVHDVALGVVNPTMARRFATCLGLRGQNEADLLYDGNQVLNVGSPEFGLVAGRGPAGPVNAGGARVPVGLEGTSGLATPLHAVMSSWVDMVAPGGRGSATMGGYLSPRYRYCVTPVWKLLISSFAVPGGPSDVGSPFRVPGAVVSGSAVSSSENGLAVGYHGAHLPDGAHGLIVSVSGAGLPYDLFIALAGIGRVFGSITLAWFTPMGPGGYPAAFSLAESWLSAMVERAVSAQGLS